MGDDDLPEVPEVPAEELDDDPESLAGDSVDEDDD